MSPNDRSRGALRKVSRKAPRKAPHRVARAFGGWFALLAVSLAASVLGPASAWAWEPATTQAGLTERALLASGFHRILAERLGRPLGALEPLALHSRLLPADLRQSLWARLALLDPAGGYRPDADGVNSALAWVTAGAVLAETPPERGRNHFLDPRTGRGLDDKGGLTGSFYALRMLFDSAGTVRGLATGTAFDLTGLASLRWIRAPENELSLEVFDSHIERAVAAVEPVEREAALTRALLALGGVLAVLQDAGEPAHVRNDFRAAFLQRQGGSSSWDRGSRFERFVADQYGRAGVPAPAKPVTRPTLEAFFTDKDGEGLADRTQRRFFSEGTIPSEIPVVASMTPKDVTDAARAELPLPLPTIPRLDLRGEVRTHYVMSEGRRQLGYLREPEGVRFFLDDAVYADSARALLPEITAYAAGFVDHLFRGVAQFTFEGDNASIKVEGFRGDKIEGKLSIFTEDQTGRRQVVAGQNGVARSLAPGEVVVVALPSGTKRVGMTLRGKDAAGPILVVAEAPVTRR
jgi:hypothetical protein